MSTVGKHGDEKKATLYVKNQGTTQGYKIWYRQDSKKFGQQLLWGL